MYNVVNNKYHNMKRRGWVGKEKTRVYECEGRCEFRRRRRQETSTKTGRVTCASHHKKKELQERVAHLMIVIVDNITVNHEEGSEMVVKAVEGIEKDVKELLRCA
jgi:hypothetical protein